MKIHHTPQQPGVDSGRAKSRPGIKDGSFGQILRYTIQDGVQQTASPKAGMPSTGLAPLTGESLDPDHHAVGLKMMDRLVDAMEVYQKHLGDSQYSLRDIEPSLNRLEKAHEHLMRFAEQTPAEGPLRDIITEGLVTTAAEISRFRNGAYC